MEEVASRKGNIVLFTDDGMHEMAAKATSVVKVPRTLYELQPLVTVVPLQLFAYHVANLLGTDVDQPRNLAKSVTVE